MQSSDFSIVRRVPRRMVPPMWVLDPSGMNITTGFLHVLLNSSELASDHPSTLRAISITAHCIPRQIPRNGFFSSRANRHARTLPITPRSPKPPGTRMPWHFFSWSIAILCTSLAADSSRSSAHTHTISSFRFAEIAACWRALVTERYASVPDVYLPTSAIWTDSERLSMRWQSCSQGVMFGIPFGRYIFSLLAMISATFWALRSSGTL
mmetsp:Transcript_67541/g.161225  ORF Transcript_67541/g.161225 Transcript_67541/m.161225 type:complete len:209 (+) Transcript_67541:558-1184(+)